MAHENIGPAIGVARHQRGRRGHKRHLCAVGRDGEAAGHDLALRRDAVVGGQNLQATSVQVTQHQPCGDGVDEVVGALIVQDRQGLEHQLAAVVGQHATDIARDLRHDAGRGRGLCQHASLGVFGIHSLAGRESHHAGIGRHVRPQARAPSGKLSTAAGGADTREDTGVQVLQEQVSGAVGIAGHQVAGVADKQHLAAVGRDRAGGTAHGGCSAARARGDQLKRADRWAGSNGLRLRLGGVDRGCRRSGSQSGQRDRQVRWGDACDEFFRCRHVFAPGQRRCAVGDCSNMDRASHHGYVSCLQRPYAHRAAPGQRGSSAGFEVGDEAGRVLFHQRAG